MVQKVCLKLYHNHSTNQISSPFFLLVIRGMKVFISVSRERETVLYLNCLEDI